VQSLKSEWKPVPALTSLSVFPRKKKQKQKQKKNKKNNNKKNIKQNKQQQQKGNTKSPAEESGLE